VVAAAGEGEQANFSVTIRTMSKKYQQIGMGGTFDHFHLGHQSFLSFAGSLSEQLQVGVTVPKLTAHKQLASLIQPYEIREKNVKDFLTNHKISAEVFPLQNFHGPTLEGSSVEAIAVTPHTLNGGERINQARQIKHLPILPIEVAALVKDENGEYISSTRIRQGIVSPDGRVFQNPIRDGLALSPQQINFFRENQGTIVKTPNDYHPLRFVIGDIVVSIFLENEWPLTLGIFDYKTQRNPYSSEAISKLFVSASIANPAGSISPLLTSSLHSSLLENSYFSHVFTNPQESYKPQFFAIDGEEDLAAVALVLVAPLNAAIYYGQPNEGMVEMIVTSELKEKFYRVLVN